MNRLIVVCIGLAFLVGCGPKIEPLPEAVTVSGKLTSAGAPVGDVVLTLQPVELGHPVPMQVGADGSYSGKIVPGKYVYFVSAKEANPNAIDRWMPSIAKRTCLALSPSQQGKPRSISRWTKSSRFHFAETTRNGLCMSTPP